MKNILQTGFLNIVKRFENNDFRAFFAKNRKFLEKFNREKIEKYDFYQNDFFKNHSCSKLCADFNAKKITFLISANIF